MDLPLLMRYLRRIQAGELNLHGRDTPEPSVFCHEIVNSAVYTFLDDAPLEERRTRAVYTRRATEPRSADDLGALDAAAIERVREEAWPLAGTPDELHDALWWRRNGSSNSMSWFHKGNCQAFLHRCSRSGLWKMPRVKWCAAAWRCSVRSQRSSWLMASVCLMHR
jgi:hypothetical protein